MIPNGSPNAVTTRSARARFSKNRLSLFLRGPYNSKLSRTIILPDTPIIVAEVAITRYGIAEAG